MPYLCNQMINLRIQLVEDILNKKRSLQEVVKILNVSRQTISKWTAQYRLDGKAALIPKKSGPRNSMPWNKTTTVIEQKVIQLAAMNKREGTVHLAEKMQELHSISINQTTIYRILLRNNIKYKDKREWKKKRKKLYTLNKPGKEIQLDTCFPFGYRRTEVIYDAIDDASRWIETETMEERSVYHSMLFVKRILSKAPFSITAIRTDCGTEFGPGFTKFLESIQIKHIKNPPYTPQHNGKIERYHRTMKSRVMPNITLSTPIEELQYKLQQFTYWYNHTKKHHGLGMNGLTPAQKLIYFYLEDSLLVENENVNLTLQFNKVV